MPIDATRHLSHRFVARGAMSQEWFAFAFWRHRVWYIEVFFAFISAQQGTNVVHRKCRSGRNRVHNSLRNFERDAMGNRVGLVDRDTIDCDHTHSIRHARHCTRRVTCSRHHDGARRGVIRFGLPKVLRCTSCHRRRWFIEYHDCYTDTQLSHLDSRPVANV